MLAPPKTSKLVVHYVVRQLHHATVSLSCTDKESDIPQHQGPGRQTEEAQHERREFIFTNL